MHTNARAWICIVLTPLLSTVCHGGPILYPEENLNMIFKKKHQISTSSIQTFWYTVRQTVTYTPTTPTREKNFSHWRNTYCRWQKPYIVVKTSPLVQVTNIPGGMVMDQFGMVGLLTFIRTAEQDPTLAQLAMGSDLTTLGLNLNSPEWVVIL